MFQNNVEPMVIDMAVEENDNTEEEPVIVESTSLVGAALVTHIFHLPYKFHVDYPSAVYIPSFLNAL